MERRMEYRSIGGGLQEAFLQDRPHEPDADDHEGAFSLTLPPISVKCAKDLGMHSVQNETFRLAGDCNHACSGRKPVG